ncbi:sulfate ABC transporter substrate-binding protein [Nocardioides sp.]|uniref:sulfate ABC transporter substrate-binding protein n=1 Tax=Nocardioides sp. TaxID=35761 RepID=UPI002723342C|nr:sulfate ABC transporter substrate-binding protein [Nocardioides sp.]MDO9457770.1 sulfate ABC transporter substrate-binding protein [Nocardioides sp.]
MNKTFKVATVVATTGVLALTACGGDSGSGDGGNVTVVGYSVLESANENLFKAFEDTDEGKDISFDGPSYGASGEQSRGVADGQKADLVHFSLEPDMTRLVDEGIVADDWKDNESKGICTQSVVVMVVKSGNPKNIEGWDDLVRDDVSVVTPNPASSGSAKWNLLAGYGDVIAGGGSEDDAKAYMEELFQNIAALPDSGRDATTAFTSGTGDVLLSYENEAILARQNGTAFDYVIPDTTLLIENPCAVTEDAEDADAANAFLDFQKSKEGQTLYAETGFRPLETAGVDDVEVTGANDEADPFPAPGTLLTIDDDFNGWGEANGLYFGDGEGDNPLGIITEIQAQFGEN